MGTKIEDYINDVSDQKTRRAIQKVFDNLGSLLADDSLKQKSLDRDYTFEEFESCPIVARKDTGGSPEASMTTTIVKELRADHATMKTSYDKMITLVTELRLDHLSSGTSYQPWLTEVDGDLDDINDYLDLLGQDGILEGDPGCVQGSSDTTKLKLAGSIRYQIGGLEYYSGSAALETEPPTGEITGSKWGAYRMDLNQSGALTVTRKGDPMAYDNEEDALLSLGSVATTANSIDVGYCALDAAAGGFTSQTDQPHSGDATVDTSAYYDVHVPRYKNGLNTAATVACANSVATLNISAINANANGLKLSEIAAAATQALDDADTVTNAKWGGWLLVVDPAGTGTYLLASDGIAGTASTMAHNDKAAVDTALDLVERRVPAHCVPIARIYLDNTSGANAWTGNTDNWDHDTAVTTTEVYPVVHDRTSGKTRSIIRPTIPSTVNAAVPAGIGAPVSGAGPDTLTANTDPVGTAGDENLLIFDDNIFEYHVLGTQTISAPVRSATGLNVGMDQTENDGVEVTQGILANSRSAFVVGTSKPFCLKVKFTIPDVSGTDDCLVGFRLAEAYQADVDDYNDMAALNVVSGDIEIHTILNDATTGETDTTDDWANTETHTLEIYVDSNGVTTFKIDGEAPSTTATFTFDDGDTVVPFFYFLHDSDKADALTLVSWECGLTSACS